MEEFLLNVEETLKKHNTFVVGLTEVESKKRLEEFGLNKLTEKKQKTTIQIIFEQLKEPMVYILAAAILITALTGDFTDSIIIAAVIFINVIVGTIQEKKAISSVESLKNLTKTKAIVRRDNKLVEIDAQNIVVGDIVVVEAGNIIPADGRVISDSNFQVIESALTGESLAVTKSANKVINDESTVLGDRKNMVYMSTLVANGRSEFVVCGCGDATEIGTIATMINTTEADLTPLQKRLAELTKVLAIISIVIVVLMIIVGIVQGRELGDLLITALSLAIAALPEGLPAVVTIVLALGTQRMVKKQAVVKTLPSVETLGAVNVICSDKTGTLTQNKMTAINLYTNDTVYEVAKINELSDLFKYGIILCNDAVVENDNELGDPTEIALVNLQSFVDLKTNLEVKFPRIKDLPFDSERKMMSTVHNMGETITYTKGAPDIVIKRCESIYIDGEVIPFENTEEVMSKVKEFSSEGLRVLALAYKPSEDISEDQMIFLGLITLIDPPRIEVAAAIVKTKSAGIKTVMITGDFKETAFAIAKQLGITNSIEFCISGQDLAKLSDEELLEKVETLSVYARVSPSDKVRIVDALRTNGNIVSMTGDGVNDAPSLKKADIGVAMGITGTEVSKDAADMILLDDNFTTIVGAVEEGRNIYKNIKKVVLFLVSCNFGEIIALFLAILFGYPAPLAAVQILWVNLITDTLPALALGVDNTNEDLMSVKPRKPSESIFAGGNLILIIVNGTFIGLLTLFVFLHFSHISLDYGRTMAFSVLGLSQLMYSLSIRSSENSIFKVNFFSNKFLLGAIVISVFLQILVIEIPLLNSIFHTEPVSYVHLGTILLFSLSVIVYSEITKFIVKKILKK